MEQTTRKAAPTLQQVVKEGVDQSLAKHLGGDESARDAQPAPAGEGDASHAGRREVGRTVERYPTQTRLEMGDGGGRLHRRRHRGAQLAGVGGDLVAAQRDHTA